MEAMGEWTAGLGGMYTTAEEADFMAQLLGSYDQTNIGGSNAVRTHQGFWIPSQETNAGLSMYSMDAVSFSMESSSTYSACTSGYYYPAASAAARSNNGTVDDTNTTINTTSYLLIEEESSSGCNADSLKGTLEVPAAENLRLQLSVATDDDREDRNIHPGSRHDSGRKRCRSSSGDIQKNKRNTKARKIQKNPEAKFGKNEEEQEEEEEEDEEEEGERRNKKKAMTMKRHNSTNSLYDEADDSIESPEASTSKGTKSLNLNGKTRAGRGAATDPQSLYARKRREKINERLKVLQSLVPNGTKVDISTMLEEAVQYVKFLQLQIKLLSSDDLWMYAPLAYNGMDIGLDKLTEHL